MNKLQLLRDLRAQTGIIELQNKEFWNIPDFPSGVARGIVVELLGNARTEWLLRLFQLHPEPYILWCERESQANPVAIVQRGIRLERIKFVNSAGDLQQPLRLALESKHYPFIIAPNRFSDIRVFQRLSILAEKSKSTVFLLGDQKFSTAWPISLQLDINFSPKGMDIFIQRQKHGVHE
jgi:hypothetical protein